MIDANGSIEFSQFMNLERRHGRDRAYEIVTEIHSRLTKMGFIEQSIVPFSDKEVNNKAFQIYEQLIEEWKDDEIPYKND